MRLDCKTSSLCILPSYWLFLQLYPVTVQYHLAKDMAFVITVLSATVWICNRTRRPKAAVIRQVTPKKHFHLSWIIVNPMFVLVLCCRAYSIPGWLRGLTFSCYLDSVRETTTQRLLTIQRVKPTLPLFATTDTSHRKLHQNWCLHEKLGLEHRWTNRSGTLQHKYLAQWCVNAVSLWCTASLDIIKTQYDDSNLLHVHWESLISIQPGSRWTQSSTVIAMWLLTYLP